MKSYLYKTILIIVLTLIWRTTHAELLILKAVNNAYQAVTKEDQNKDTIYALLMKYQWPMCTLRLNDISQEEQKSLFEDISEAQFIQNKIHQETDDTNYRVVFVPTTLYELYCLKNKILKNTNFDDQGIGKIFKKIPSLDNNREEVINGFKAINEDPKTKDCFFELNQGFFQFLHDNIPNLTPENLKDLLAKKSILSNINEKLSPGPITSEFIKMLIPLEFRAQEKHLALLFRIKTELWLSQEAIEKIQDRNWVKITKSLNDPSFFQNAQTIDTLNLVSLSFGNSFFAGKFNFASPEDFFNDHDETQILALSKKSIATGTLCSLFYIAPRITCAALFSSDYLAQSRTKTVGLQPITNHPDLIGFYYDTHDKSGLIYKQVTTEQDILQHNKALAKCLANDAAVFIKTWDICKTPQYMQNQKAATDLYKTIGLAKFVHEQYEKRRERDKQHQEKIAALQKDYDKISQGPDYKNKQKALERIQKLIDEATNKK